MKNIKKITALCAALFLVLPYAGSAAVKADEGPVTPTFYDSYFEYKLVTDEGYLIDSWSEEYSRLEEYEQPEVEEAERPEIVPVYCIENHYYGVDSNIVIPESSADGCGFEPIESVDQEPTTNAGFYTASAADYNGFNAIITKYWGPPIQELVIPEYLNDGTKVYGLNFGFGYSRRDDSGREAVEKLIISPGIDNVHLEKYDFPNLREISAEGNSSYTSVDGVLYSSDMRRLEMYPPERPDREFTIPDGVENMDNFNGNKHLEEITIPASLYSVNTDFISDMNLKKVNVAEGNPIYDSEDGLLFGKDYASEQKVLIFYPADKTDKTFTVPDGMVVDLTAFGNNEYLEEITLGSIRKDAYSGIMPGNLPNLKSFVIDEAKVNQDYEKALWYNEGRYFTIDGIIYYCREPQEGMSAEDMLNAGAELIYYPPGKEDVFFEVPAMLANYDRVLVSDHVEAVYYHGRTNAYVEGKGLKAAYFKNTDDMFWYGSDVRVKDNISLEDAKADFEAMKNAPEPTEEPEITEEPEETPEAAPEPEKTPEPAGKPAEQQGGSNGILIFLAVAAAAAAGVFAWMKTKKKQ